MYIFKYNKIKKKKKKTKKTKLAKDYNVKKEQIRFWNVVRRQNRTKRPELPTDENDNMSKF